MYARCKEEECEEYATQCVGSIFRTRLRNICRIPIYLPARQYLMNSQSLHLSEYRANLVNKEGEPSLYSPPSNQFTRLVNEYCAKVVIISDSAIGALPLSLSVHLPLLPV